MTSVTPKSAMTSVTDSLSVSLSLAAQGARRATGAVKESVGLNSSEPIVVLVNNDLIDFDAKLLSRHIDGRDHIFVSKLWRQPEFLAEDVQHGVATDETHQVIATALGLGQRMLGCCGRFRQSNLGLPQRHLWRASLQLGVAIARVMFCFKDQRFSIQVLSSLHQHAAQETTAVMVIKLFHDPVTPRFSHGNKPKLNALGQAKANETAHSARVSMTAIENQLIIYLLMLGYTQTPPVSPDRVDRRLRGFVKDGRHGTATGGEVHAVHTVKAQRPAQVTRTNVIALMYFIGVLALQRRIALALWFIAPRAAVRQPFATYYPADGPQARQRRNLQRFQFPTNCLRTTKQSLVVQVQTRQLDRFDDFTWQLPRIAMWPSCLFFLPMVCFVAGLIALNPLVNPRPPMTKLLGDRRYRFAFQVRLNCMFSIALWLLLHAFLPKEKGPDDEATPLQSSNKLVFQRTVFDVMAHRRVTDVMTLVT